MTVYTYTPSKNYKRISGLVVILISAALGFFMFPTLFPTIPLRWLFQLTGLVCLGVVIFIVSRYILKNTVYSILENGEGGCDLAVTEITNGGRSRVTVCRFALANIERAEIFFLENAGDAERKKKFLEQTKKPRPAKFNYCPDMMSSPVCYILANEGENKFLVKLSPDKKLYEYIKGENKADIAQ